MKFIPVGRVRSPVSSSRVMQPQGVTARIEIFPPFREALMGIETNTHLIVLGWMHNARRDLLRAVPRKISPDLPERGVFALRSPSRPNPISVSIVRLAGLAGDDALEVDNLDLIDGTLVLDIKPYQAGWDCVFSASGHNRTEKIGKMGPARYRETLAREAVSYHGEWCPGAALAVRMAEYSTGLLGGDLRRPEVTLALGNDPCITDSLIGITGARAGNMRLLFPGPGDNPPYILSTPGCRVSFLVRAPCGEISSILARDVHDLFVSVDSSDG